MKRSIGTCIIKCKCVVYGFLVFSLLLISGCGDVVKEPMPDGYMSAAEAEADLRYLVNKLEENHPGPYKYISKVEFYGQLNGIKKAFNEKVSVKDFSESICWLLSQLRDGHTRHKDMSWYYVYLNKGGKIFPLKLRYDGGVMKVDVCSAVVKDSVGVGDVVVSINNEPMDSILGRYGRYDAKVSDPQRAYSVESNFDLFHFIENDNKDEYHLELRNKDGNRYSVTLPAVPYWKAEATEPSGAKEMFGYTFYDKGKVVLFRAQSFNSKYTNIIDKKLFQMMSEMKKNKTNVFVFDLRGNGGGNAGLGTAVVNMFIDKKYCDDFYPANGNYPCKIVLLCDRGTASASSWIATYAKDYGFGVIAGEETGGLASFYGDIEFFELPNSKLTFGVSTRYFPRPSQEDDGKGVLCDVTLDVRASDEVIIKAIMSYLSASY